MKQTGDAANLSRTAQLDSHAPGRNVIAFVALGLVCMFCILLVLFARSYKSLRDAILQERVDYVAEISAQIISSHLFMEQEYAETAANLAAVLERNNVTSLSDVHDFVANKDRGDILLISENNDVVDLNGRHISMPNDALRQRMLANTGVTTIFTSLNYAEDSWLFAAPFSPKEIDGAVYTAVILSVPADAFRDNMTISLFDNLGASYIVNNDGRIRIKPPDGSLAFNGYNLFSSMLSQGASPEDIILLENAMRRGEEGSALLRVGRLDWLIGHTPIDASNAIVVTVPLTLTAAQTYQGLTRTIVLSTLSVVIISMIAIMMILQFFRRDKARAKEALAVAAKSEFFSKMSHDIRTPLNAVIGLVQLAQDESTSPVVREYLDQSLSSSRYLLGIINDVLDVSRIESGKFALSEGPFDMNAALSDVKAFTRPMLDEKALVFTDEATDVYDTTYIGDAVRIKQILTNLLSNATKFTKPGGHIRLSVTNTHRPDGYDVFTMVVSDTGIGMSERFLHNVFSPFEQEVSSYTQQYAGSGLGLSIVHDIVSQMNGAITVDSELDKGSTFTVTLPLLRGGPLPAQEQPRERTPATFAGRRILMAEDNALNRTVAEKLLQRKFDIETVAAADGEIALSMFADAPPGTYDLILMDVKMPNMDGLAATRAIRALPRPDAKTIPIIALSANAYKEDVALSLEAGMNDHVSKPLDINALAEIFLQYFR